MHKIEYKIVRFECAPEISAMVTGNLWSYRLAYNLCLVMPWIQIYPKLTILSSWRLCIHLRRVYDVRTCGDDYGTIKVLFLELLLIQVHYLQILHGGEAPVGIGTIRGSTEFPTDGTNIYIIYDRSSRPRDRTTPKVIAVTAYCIWP